VTKKKKKKQGKRERGNERINKNKVLLQVECADKYKKTG